MTPINGSSLNNGAAANTGSAVSSSAVSNGGAAIQAPIPVSICDTQPATIEGIRTLLASLPDLKFGEGTGNLNRALEIAREQGPGIVIIDKAFGIQGILDWMALAAEAPALAGAPPTRAAVVIWGVSVTEAEALRFLQSGARGILRKTAALPSILACLRTVAAGRSWMEDCVFRDAARERYPRHELTAREQQVLELVEQGCKNKEIAQELGIRPGTVKIHLKHIFEKTGIRGRYGLALNGWRDRGPAQLPA